MSWSRELRFQPSIIRARDEIAEHHGWKVDPPLVRSEGCTRRVVMCIGFRGYRRLVRNTPRTIVSNRTMRLGSSTGGSFSRSRLAGRTYSHHSVYTLWHKCARSSRAILLPCYVMNR